MLYNRFVCWAEHEIWEDSFSALAGAEDAPDRLFIDSSCIKVDRTAGGAKLNAGSAASRTGAGLPHASTEKSKNFMGTIAIAAAVIWWLK